MKEEELKKPGFFCLRCAARVDRGDVVKPFENMQGMTHATKAGKVCGGNVIEIKKRFIPTGRFELDFQAWQSRDNMQGIAWALLMNVSNPEGEFVPIHFSEAQLDLLLKVINEVLVTSKRLYEQGAIQQ